MTKVPFSSIKSEDIWCLDDEQDHLMDLIDPDASMDDELFEHVKYLIEKGLRYLLDRDGKLDLFPEGVSRITAQDVDWDA